MIVELVTSAELRDYYRDDLPLVSELESRGATVRPWVWREEPSESCDVVVVRTTWDYANHLPEFRRWLARLDGRAARILNSPHLMGWNLDKRYLIELENSGAAIPATVVIDGPVAISSLHRDLSCREIVVKPVFSAGGWHALLLREDESSAQARLDELLRTQGPLLAQELVSEIDHGELSLVFFEGRYSHAVLKRAKPGEFRVQIEHGGTVEDAIPAPGIVRAAERVVAALPEVPSYARVDGVVRGTEIVLMEVELIEPELFFAHDPGAAATFADIILR